MDPIEKYDFPGALAEPRWESGMRPLPDVQNFWYLIERVNELVAEVRELRQRISEATKGGE